MMIDDEQWTVQSSYAASLDPGCLIHLPTAM